MKKLTKFLAFIPLAFLMVGCGEKNNGTNSNGGSNSNSGSSVSTLGGDFIPIAYNDDGFLNRTDIYSGKDGYGIKSYIQIDGKWYEREREEIIYDSNNNLVTTINKEASWWSDVYYNENPNPDNWNWYGSKYEYTYAEGTKNGSKEWISRKQYSWDNETKDWKYEGEQFKDLRILNNILSDAKQMLLEAQAEYPNFSSWTKGYMVDEGSNTMSVTLEGVIGIDGWWFDEPQSAYTFNGEFKVLLNMSQGRFTVELNNFSVNGKSVGWNGTSFYFI